MEKIRLYLESSKEWDMFLSLTQMRTLLTLHFLVDVEGTLKALSLAFQGKDLTPSVVFQAIEETYLRLELMKTEDGIALAQFKLDFDSRTDSFEGFNMENREEGEAQFAFDRNDLLVSTALYLRGRFDPLLQNPILRAMRDSFEHRLWPPPADPRFAGWGVPEIVFLAAHYHELTSMRNFDLNEALHEWSRIKRELSGAPFFGLSYKMFWEHVSRHYDTIHGYQNIIILTRISCLMLPDSSICEVGFSAYNRTHTAERANLKTSTVRNVLLVRAHGPKSVRFAFYLRCYPLLGVLMQISVDWVRLGVSMYSYPPSNIQSQLIFA